MIVSSDLVDHFYRCLTHFSVCCLPPASYSVLKTTLNSTP
jgi:hypothetical protein